jgi:HSP20 family protein
MLMRFDPFRDLDRITEALAQQTQQAARSFPMDAYRRGEQFVVHFDLPGVDADDIDITVERNVLTVRAVRRFERQEGDEILASERPQGSFQRQLLLGETLDGDALSAGYDRGVLTLTIPVAERARPRKVPISASSDSPEIVEGKESG